uniref:L-Fucosyltransferase n=1 Tax=Anopheles epiroticus TaxID=199890 RepID=A0A182P458_9DIPT
MIRFVVQLVLKNIKPLILIVSFLTFIWLIVDTANRPEFVRHASKHSFRFGGNSAKDQDDQWYQRSVEQFLELLEIDPNATAEENGSNFVLVCPQENTLLFTAFAGGSLDEHLWHYFSLVAMQSSVQSTASDYRVQLMLTRSALTELSSIFLRIPFDVIDLSTVRCYDLAAASILNSDTSIQIGESSRQFFILNNQAKRFEEILKASWQQQKQSFKFREGAERAAFDVLYELRQRAKLYGDEEDVHNLQYVGVHIREDGELPYEYYYRAMAFHRKMHDTGILLFVTICENPKSTICSTLNAQNERIEVIEQHDEIDVDFALLTRCNHTILSSERDVFPALLRGTGNVVVFGEQNEGSSDAIELASFRENWYIIE